MQPALFLGVLMRRSCFCSALLFLLATGASAARMGLHVFTESQPAPSLELSDEHGKLHRLKDYRDKTVIVNFWASWCAPCRKEMPSLQATQKALRDDGLVVLAISMDDSWKEMAKGLEGYENDFVALLDENGETADRWGAIAVPTAFVVDKQGLVRLRVIGGYDWEAPDLRSRIEDLMYIP